MDVYPHSEAHLLHTKAEIASGLRRYNEAKELAIQAISLEPQYGDGHASLGRALLGLGQVDGATEQFRTSLQIDPENLWYLTGFAVCLKTKGNLTEALKTAERLVELFPYLPKSFITRGDIRHSQKKYRLARVDYEHALELDPVSAEAHSSLGLTLLEQKQYQLAEKHFRESLALMPESARTINNLGVALDRQKKLKQAALAYKSALLLEPTLTVAKENTKSAIDRYLSYGLGATLFIVAMGGRLAATIAITPAGIAIAIAISALILGLLVRSWFTRQDRKRDLQCEDPQLLELYQIIKRDR